MRRDLDTDPMSSVFQDSGDNPFTGYDPGEWPNAGGESMKQMQERIGDLSRRAKERSLVTSDVTREKKQ